MQKNYKMILRKISLHPFAAQKSIQACRNYHSNNTLSYIVNNFGTLTLIYFSLKIIGVYNRSALQRMCQRSAMSKQSQELDYIDDKILHEAMLSMIENIHEVRKMGSSQTSNTLVP